MLRAKPVVEDARERRRDHLRANGSAARFVVGLVTAFDVAVPSHVLLRLGVASERASERSESKASPTPSIMAVQPVGQRSVLGRLQADMGVGGLIVNMTSLHDILMVF